MGDRLRVTTDKYIVKADVSKAHLGPYRIVGTLDHMVSDSLVLVVADPLVLTPKGSMIYVPESAISHVDLSRGRSSNAGKGALIGLAIGAGVGILWGYNMGVSTLRAAALFGSIGAGGGALAGLGVRSENWDRIYSDVPLTESQYDELGRLAE